MQRMFGLWHFNVEILTLLLLLLDGVCKETPGRMVQSYYGVGLLWGILNSDELDAGGFNAD